MTTKKSEKMKKIILGLTILNLIVLPALVQGQAPGSGVVPGTATAPKDIGLIGALNLIFNWVYTIVFVLAAFFLLLAAYTFITAGGDPEKVGKARGYLLYAIIGVIVGVLAYGLVSFVRSQLEVLPTTP